MSVTIDEFNILDSFELNNISNDDWKDNIDSIVYNFIYSKNDIEKILVLKVNNRIVGFIYMYVISNKLLIPEFMYIKKEYRKKGYGSKLLKEAEIRSGCQTSQIFFNKALSTYYEKEGYTLGENLVVGIKNL